MKRKRSKTEEMRAQEIEHRHEQSRQQVDGLAIFDVHHAQTCGSNQHTAHDRDFGDQSIGNEARRKFGNAVDSTLPQEDKQTGDAHPKAIARGHHYHSYQVERGRCHQIGIVALECRQNRSHHRERAYTAEQNTGRDAFGEVASVLRHAARGFLHAFIEAQHRAQQTAERQTKDEQRGEMTLVHV